MKLTDQEVVDALVERNEAEVAREEAELPLNRAQRRLMVANMKVMLASGPRQVPVRNATIIPRATRRRQKNQRSRK